MSLSHFIKFQKQNSSSLHELHAEDLEPPTCVSLCILKAMVKLTELESMWKALLLYRLCDVALQNSTEVTHRGG